MSTIRDEKEDKAMSNFDEAVEVLREAYREKSMSPVHACDIMATALEAAGLLAPDVQIIRTLKEVEALDPDTMLSLAIGEVFSADSIEDYFAHECIPAVVIATGDHVRAARKAMELDNG